jgi:hypothetical protein
VLRQPIAQAPIHEDHDGLILTPRIVSKLGCNGEEPVVATALACWLVQIILNSQGELIALLG